MPTNKSPRTPSKSDKDRKQQEEHGNRPGRGGSENDQNPADKSRTGGRKAGYS